ncbi:MAG: hypothetical protein PHV28_14120 [Kiritimatiellae bacterium]|nr:hypothetical protein [Kiritimatiellia bacterium]
MRFFWEVVLVSIVASVSGAVELPEVPEEALAELGTTLGMPQRAGFVFIEGRYLPPPYTVTRKGNGIFINRIQIQQPVPWDAFNGAPGNGTGKKAVDADGDFEKVDAPQKTASPGDSTAPQAVKSIDDLFADGEEKPAMPANAAPEPQAPARTAKALGTEEVKQKKDELRANLERLRKGYEQALAQGEMFFFSQRHNRVNGNYGTARTLMGVLPKALRHAQSPQDLMARLNQGGVYFIDLGMCSALFKNKHTFPLLEERLTKIEETEAEEALRRKSSQRW